MIRDNVMLPALKATPKEAQAVVARVEALLERFGIDHLQELSTAEAMGGQLQWASICRALAAEPDLVFADEPTATLTGPMTADVMDALTEGGARGRDHDPSLPSTTSPARREPTASCI